MKEKQKAVVRSQRELAPGIFDMWIETGLAEEAHPGQFIGVYPKDKSTLLPRPISICEVDGEGKALRIVYRVAGAGTREFSGYQPGEAISILGILGNGFPVEEAKGKKVFLMGGGIGVPPILELAKQIDADKQIIVGYRNKDTFLKEDFEKYGKVFIATEDGSVGTKGNVMDAIEANALEADMIYACRARCPCFAPSKHMGRRITVKPISHWKSIWRAALGHALAVLSKPDIQTIIPM